MIEFLKANVNHDILFILSAIAIFIGYIGGFILISAFIAFHVKERDSA